MVRDGKPKDFFYLDHRTVDSHYAIVTHMHVTVASVYDSMLYLGRLDRKRERFRFTVRAVSVDARYQALVTMLQRHCKLQTAIRCKS